MNAADEDSWTALHLAAQGGHAEVVQLLLGAGSAVDAQTSAGATVLHIAAQEGYIEVVQLLLDAGADPADLA